jgi:nicotinate-nucleotide pyrophosphorylase (carboxylating)
MNLITPHVRALIRMALEEDLGRGDLTAEAVPIDTIANARVIARGPSVASGLALIEAVFAEASFPVDRLAIHVRDGEEVANETEIFRVRANARALLGVERTILNFLQRTFGIAAQARSFRNKAEELGLKIKVTDTRKTLPAWRLLDKAAVRDGGLHNHRFGLDSGVLLKENHIRAAGGIRKAVKNLEGKVPHGISVECEVTSLTEAFEAIEAGVRILLLDNFTADKLPAVVSELRARAPELLLECSGNITLDTFPEYARAGVDLVSVGALTHSAKAANLSMLFDFAHGK